MVPFVGGLRFSLQTARLEPESKEAQQQLRLATGVVGVAEGHIAGREWFVGERFSAADIVLYGYLHAADRAMIDLSAFAGLSAWLERVRTRPNHVADLADIPDNGKIGSSKSVYDLLGV